MSSHPAPAADAVILAAGGVLTRGPDEVMIVHRKRHNDWSLPKGKLDPGESFEQAALREVREETGCVAELREYLGAVGYEAKGRPKAVLFWRMSLVEQREVEHPEEVDQAVWLPVMQALERLTYPHERELLARSFPHQQPQADRRAQPRLLHALAAFEVELKYLEERPSWTSTSARAHLASARQYAAACDNEGAWQALHAAQRAAFRAFSSHELALRAAVLRTEVPKLTGWRAGAVTRLLGVPDDQLTPARLAEAALVRDEDAANRYHRIELMARQVKLLFRLLAGGTLAFLAVMLWAPRDAPAPGWEYPLVAAVLLFGFLGACFSAAQSLIGSTSSSRIPERIANRHVTLSRVVFGAVAGLAGYAFIQSRVLNIQLGDNNVAAALTIAFLFGYAGDRAIARVAVVVGGGDPAK